MQTRFQFWQNNQITGHIYLTPEQITTVFKLWLSTKEREWVAYYSCQDVVTSFITDKEGLSSTFEQSELAGIIDVLKPYYLEKIQ